MLARLLVATAYLVHSIHSFAPYARHIVHSHSAIIPVVTTYAMPEQLSEWGCDATLWDGMPPGSHRDLERYVREGLEELARNRIATMREIVVFVDDDPGSAWEQVTWDKAVQAWETLEAEKSAAELAKAKAEKKAKAKADREAAEAAKAQQHGL
mmetsp:Transcript_21813/g.25978  ORF Transcript_21813/g.25978 Transcript_21813/m.25978 type:complete len:154 (-) Transcript_21813:394-855(-)|eukprot:CAMPEP_0198275832 /NCGR_PEP_ID=MMETSP1447-20131203/64989_1 /TAXON_ID=420782 /ORGANISM="Chaetoceros dichaeta, Strain CCMP1751" /LENGTH=153 /DNA_ID=CAMNT_0043970737 /DNA_START=106 /DNA_END=567 /DNA_ORIENTATION=-